MMKNLQKKGGETLGKKFSKSPHLAEKKFPLKVFQADSTLVSGRDVSHEKKPSYFPLYWLINRDPYNGL